MDTPSTIRVLIVDDSSVIRTLLTKILSSDPEIEVVGTAQDPYVAREKLVHLKPDVMTLDVEMPRMDGLSFLEKVMEHFPVRTIVVSSLTAAGSETYFRALALGAVDVVEKPSLNVSQGMAAMSADLIARVKSASRARIAAQKPTKNVPNGLVKQKSSGRALPRTTHKIVAIAASTGGTEALKKVMANLPRDTPGTVIVQHMPPLFTKTFASHLNDISEMEVREAIDGDRILPGLALVAPGNFHMRIERTGGHYLIRLSQEDLLHGVRPAADLLFYSVAEFAGSNAVGVILTGMGRDGAKGLLRMREAGALTIGQDEKTCVVYGMPKAAFEIGAVTKVLPLEKIARDVSESVAEQGAA